MISGRGSAPAWVTRTPAAKAPPRTGIRAIPALRWVASWSGRRAVLVLLVASLLGVAGTVVIGHDPGFLVGFFLVVGSVVAAVGARHRVHRLIPLPALSYLVAVTLAGYVHDRSVLHGGKEWTSNFLTWIGSAFFALVWATALIMAIAVVRGVLGRRLAARRPSAGSPAGRAASGSARPDPWSGRGQADARGRGPRGAARTPSADRAPGGNAFEADGTGPWGDDPGSRDSREDRDPWGDSGPRQPPSPRRAPGPGRDPRGTDRTGGQDGRLARGQRDADRPRDDWSPKPPRDARDNRGQRQEPYPGPRDSRRPPPKGTPRDLW